MNSKTSLSEIKNKGYWTVNDVEYDVKVNAILAAQDLGLGLQDIKFHYNDAWWNAKRWDIEPTKSLKDLYVERARQLRDQYDTLILRFSGGADSTNILRTFVDNNIKLDVVSINMWYLDGADPWTEPSNKEKRDIAIPLAKQLLDQGADFELVINNFTQTHAKVGNDPNWIFRVDAPRLSCIDICYHQASTTVEYEKWNDPTTCIITGIDKPFIFFNPEHDIWYSKLPDVMHSAITQSSKMVQEPFYWTADLPEIIIKQSHVLKNYYKDNLEKMSDQGSNHKIDHKGLFNKKQIIPLIYPEYYGFLEPGPEPLPYYDMSVDLDKARNNKPGAPRGFGFDFNIEKSPYYQSWVDGVNLADKLINREFKFQDSIWGAGLEWIYTKKQWLGK
jgi:hypothetical protein